MGHNDGSVKGVRIFECPEQYGAFIRGTNVKVGDFPVRDIFDSDNEHGDQDGHSHQHDDDEDEI